MNAIESRQGWKSPDLAWLGLACAVHGLVLLLPLGSLHPPQARTGDLVVELVPRTPAPAAENAPAQQGPMSPALAEAARPMSRDPDIGAGKPGSLIPAPDPAVAPAADAAPPPPTAASLWYPGDGSRLLSRDSSLPPAPGRHSTLTARAARSAGVLPRPTHLAPSWLDGIVSPARPEVLDRWLAADGSHNVVLALPGGSTLCGRAEPWNPMQPLVEHVMLFRECGSGLKPSFRIPAIGDTSPDS